MKSILGLIGYPERLLGLPANPGRNPTIFIPQADFRRQMCPFYELFPYGSAVGNAGAQGQEIAEITIILHIRDQVGMCSEQCQDNAFT